MGFFTDNLYTSTNWSDGNCLASFIQALVLYVIFVISSKMKIIYTIYFFGLLFILYFVNTQRIYFRNKNEGIKVPKQNVKCFGTQFLLRIC